MVEVGLDHLPDRGAVFDVLAQQVPAGDVGDAEPLGQKLGLRSLAGARRADQQQAHLVTGLAGSVRGRVTRNVMCPTGPPPWASELGPLVSLLAAAVHKECPGKLTVLGALVMPALLGYPAG